MSGISFGSISAGYISSGYSAVFEISILGSSVCEIPKSRVWCL